MFRRSVDVSIFNLPIQSLGLITSSGVRVYVGICFSQLNPVQPIENSRYTHLDSPSRDLAGDLSGCQYQSLC